MATDDKAIALTFDACGGKGGSGYDAKLINYLIQHHIPATLFINSRWIDENYSTFMALATNPLFEIENHGYLHRPLSINGKSAWGIPGTQNVGQIVDEVIVNADKIQRLTGRRPIYFRSGTAYYDEDAVQIANDLGVRCVNFSILGDAGATFNTQQIVHACLQAKPGSVIICHMNHPEKDTAEGIMAVVPKLKQKGFRFVKLAAYPLV
jgi:peptidoglycan/xylan/chitin deacetylase (PgdA/CDA1 family)